MSTLLRLRLDDKQQPPAWSDFERSSVPAQRLAARLIEAREKQGLSQRGLAVVACVPMDLIKRLEAGRDNELIEMLGFICEALQIDPVALFAEIL